MFIPLSLIQYPSRLKLNALRLNLHEIYPPLRERCLSGTPPNFCYNRERQFLRGIMQGSSFVRRLDFGLFAVLALCLFTLWPLLHNPGLPNGTDTLYHVYRVAEMDRSWSHGVLMPRWAESFYFGYGSPVFQYYASLTYYLTSLLMRITASDSVNALRLLTVISMLGAGAGMYLFVRGEVSKLAGIIAAVVYVYSPYIFYTEPYARGVYPELLSFALFPFVLWFYGRLMRTGLAWAMIPAALGSAALILTHNLMGLVLTGMLMAWLGWNFLTGILAKKPLRENILALVTAILGIGLAAFFWIPVILEQDAVPLGNLTAVALLDYRNFFVPLDKLLALTSRSDAGSINGLLHQLNLGVAQWVLALMGIVGVLTMYVKKRAQHGVSLHTLLFFALMSGILIFLMLPAAEFLWGAVSRLAFLQFPWRFLGPAAFCLAVLAGMNALWIERLPSHNGGIMAAAFVIAPITLAMPTFYVPEWTNMTVDTSTAAYQQAEMSGLQMATTYSNEYLPINTHVMPDPTARLIADYADGYPVNKANFEILPPGVEIEPLEHGPQHDVWRAQSDQPFTLEILTFYFPGWQAEIDGAPVEVRPSDSHGLITLDVPAGEHTIRVFLGATPAVSLGLDVTVGAVVVLVGVVIFVLRRGMIYPTGTSDGHHVPTSTTLNLPHRIGIVAGGIIQLVLVLVLMRERVMWVNSPPGKALLAQNQITYNLGDQIQLLGYDLNGQTFRPGDHVDLTLYWYARSPIPYGYASFVHISSDGPPLAQQDKFNPAGRPTLAWSTDGNYYDPYVITLPADMPPGDYQIRVGLYTCDTLPEGECGNGDRPAVTDANGDSLGDFVPLATITVR
jgi:6-pyruvoyl-tetrahydropterin synthase related domain